MAINPEDRERVGRKRSQYTPDPTPKKSGNPLVSILGAALLGAVVAILYINQAVLPGLMAKGDFDAKVTALTAEITKAQAVATQATNAAGQAANAANQAASTIQSSLSGVVKSDQLASVNNNVSALNSQLAAKATQVDVTSLKALVTDLQTRLLAAEAKLTPSTTSTGGSSSIPGVTIVVDVKDEGTLQSDNSTRGEIKVTFTNSGTKDIEDLVVSLLAYTDDCSLANQTLTTSGYGAWSVRTRQIDEIEIRGRLAKLESGEIRKIYLYIKSFANDYKLGNTTYLDTSSSEIDVISWDYAS